MNKSIIIFMLTFFLWNCICLLNSNAATINAASCSQSDVQNALNSASNGDTITIPSGECTWSKGITTTKQLTIIGAGQGSTILTDILSDTFENGLFAFNTCSDDFRLSGMTIVRATAKGNGIIVVKGNCSSWRIDHITINANASSGTVRGILARNPSGHPEGLIDHYTFNKNGDCSANPILVWGADDTRTSNVAWGQDVNFGGSDWLFVEDSIIDFSAVSGSGNSYQDSTIDCKNGGKFVFRHNTVIGAEVGNHGYDSATRSCLAMEVYNNTFSNDGANPGQAVHFRGGTGLVYSNTITGKFTRAIALYNYRSCEDAYCWGSPLTTCADFVTDWCDGNTVANEDQLGDGNTEPIETYHGWPCRDQIGRGEDQNAYPVYQWNNTLDGNSVTDCTVVDAAGTGTCYTSTHIQKNRDYFNSQMEGYSAYIYPNPLSKLNPVENFRFK